MVSFYFSREACMSVLCVCVCVLSVHVLSVSGVLLTVQKQADEQLGVFCGGP